MEYRRIQKTGKSTYIISLPKSWADRNGVKAGTEAAITENEDASLTLSTRPRNESYVARINNSKNIDKNLQRIIAAYLAGANRIVLRGDNSAIVAEEARLLLSGVEISEEKSDEITLDVFYKDRNMGIGAILKRMHTGCLTLIQLCSRMKEGETELKNEVERREKEIDRLYILLLRALSMENLRPTLTINNALAAKSLERISDHAEGIAKKLPGGSDKRNTAEALSLIGSVYEKVMENFFAGSSPEEMHDQVADCKRRLARLYSQSDKEEDRRKREATKDILESCIRISEYVDDLMEITDDMIAAKNMTLGVQQRKE
jgi:phosphate uptake regulator